MTEFDSSHATGDQKSHKSFGDSLLNVYQDLDDIPRHLQKWLAAADRHRRLMAGCLDTANGDDALAGSDTNPQTDDS